MKLFILAFLLSILLFGCEAGILNHTKELGNGYTYNNENSYIKSVISAKNSIYSDVVNYVYDIEFILAIQKPNKEVYRVFIASELRNNNRNQFIGNVEKDILESVRKADSLIRYDSFYINIFARKINYWIISHKNNQEYGPFTEKEYLKKRAELGVPNNLQLKKTKQG